MGKKISIATRRRDGLSKSQLDQPERFSTGELHRGRREDHTPKRFVPAAQEAALRQSNLQEGDSCKSPAPKKHFASGRISRRSPSTLLLNRTNVKRKSSARGRARS